MILVLNSVGSVIDTETKLTYPMYNETAQKKYGTLYDSSDPVHLDDCDKQWVDTLSEDDIILINEKVLTKH